MWQIFNLKTTPENTSLKKRFFFNWFRGKTKLETIEDVQSYAESLPNLAKEFDTTIKFWLPEVVYQCIQEHIRSNKRYTISEAIREYLFIHCYGRAAVYHLRGEFWTLPSGNILYRRKMQETDPEFIELNIPDLGKNIHPIKLCCHHKLKDDLITLATLRNMPLSEYLREIIITYYLGNGFLPNQNDVIKDEYLKAYNDFLVSDEVINVKYWRD